MYCKTNVVIGIHIIFSSSNFPSEKIVGTHNLCFEYFIKDTNYNISPEIYDFKTVNSPFPSTC